jgi:hypothetical protein
MHHASNICPKCKYHKLLFGDLWCSSDFWIEHDLAKLISDGLYKGKKPTHLVGSFMDDGEFCEHQDFQIPKKCPYELELTVIQEANHA